jgi:hypothetical protein
MVNFAAAALKLLLDVIKGEWHVKPANRGAEQTVNWNL